MTKTIFIINGPNLNMLGTREPEIYGTDTLDDITGACEKLAAELGVQVRFFQSNSEGELIGFIQQAQNMAQAVILNGAAYTHTSVGLYDALTLYDGYKIELHISNPHAREPFRHHSYLSAACHGVMAGFGAQGYEAALRLAAHNIAVSS